MSSNYSGTDTHGLMTVHLAVLVEIEAPPWRSQVRPGGTAIPDVAAGMELPVLYYDPVPGLPTSGTEGPSYGWRATKREGAGMLTGGHRTAESQLDAEVRDSPQFEMPTPHMCALSQFDVTPDTVFELWKRFQTHHTHRTHKWTVPLLLVAPTIWLRV